LLGAGVTTLQAAHCLLKTRDLARPAELSTPAAQ
jgi:hypothetical protein